MNTRNLAVVGLLIAALAVPAVGQEEDRAGALVAEARRALDALRFEDARGLLDRAIELARKDPGEPRIEAEALRLRSAVNEQLKRPEAALADARSALELVEKQVGDRQDALVPDLLAVGRLAPPAGREPEAIAALERALRALAKAEPRRPEQELAALHPLARLQQKNRLFEQAIASHEAYVELVEELRGELHADTALPLWEIAHCRRLLGDPEAAIPALERWIAVFAKAKGEGDPSTAKGVAALVDCRLALGRLDEAEEGCRAWLKLLAKVSKEHPDAIKVLERLAEIESRRGNLPGEIAHLEDALRRARRLTYPDQVRDAGLLRRLASSLRRDGQTEKALGAIDEAMALAEGNLPANDPERQLVRLERGRVAEARGENAAAEADYKAVLAAFEKLAGSEHPALVEPLEALAALYRKLDRKDELAVIEKRLAALLKRD